MNSLFCPLICVVFFVALACPILADDAPKVEVKVAGVRVVGNGYGGGADRLLPLNGRRGTTVALMVSAEEGSILDLDPSECTLDFFKDDKGTNLRPKPDPARPAFGLFPRQSGDRRAALLEVSGSEVAARGARELRIKGTLNLVVGREKKTERTGEITARAGAAAVLGPRTVAILTGLPFPGEERDEEKKEEEKSEKKDGEDEIEGVEKEGGEFVLSLRIDGEPDNVTNVRVLDGDGEPVKVKVLGTRTIRRGDVRVIHRFRLPAGFDGEIMIEADIWDGRRKVRIPFEETVSVGLGD